MVIELTEDEQAQLTRMAAATQRSESDLAREAMHWFLEPRDPDTDVVLRARAQIEAGRTITHEELFAEIDQQLSC